MQLNKIHNAFVDFLKSNSKDLGVPSDNIRKGVVGDYATNFPSILTHLLPNNEGEMFATGIFENNWTLQVAYFDELESNLYDISEKIVELICDNLHPYKVEFMDIETDGGKGYIVYEFRFLRDFIRI